MSGKLVILGCLVALTSYATSANFAAGLDKTDKRETFLNRRAQCVIGYQGNGSACQNHCHCPSAKCHPVTSSEPEALAAVFRCGGEPTSCTVGYQGNGSACMQHCHCPNAKCHPVEASEPEALAAVFRCGGEPTSCNVGYQGNGSACQSHCHCSNAKCQPVEASESEALAAVFRCEKNSA